MIRLLRLKCVYKYAEIVKKIIETMDKITIKGVINFNHLSYPTFTMASEARINPVGLIKANNPTPKRYALTTCSLPIETVSARGDRTGIVKTAIPDEDGIKNDNVL